MDPSIQSRLVTILEAVALAAICIAAYKLLGNEGGAVVSIVTGAVHFGASPAARLGMMRLAGKS